MKTRIIKSAFIAVIALFGTVIGASAQNRLSNSIWENGRIVSTTQVVLGESGLYEYSAMTKNTYDKSGELLKKELYKWNKTSEEWMPESLIVRSKDAFDETISIDLMLWNKNTKNFESKETMIYKLNETNDRFLYYAYVKDNWFTEIVNVHSENTDYFAKY